MSKLVPPTRAQVIRYFGDPAPYIRTNGVVSPGWEAKIIAYIKLPAPLPLSWNKKQVARRLKVHRLVAPFMLGAMNEIHADKEAWASINDIGGCYEFRRIGGTKELSDHCWAVAIDWDVLDNPMFRLIPRVHPRIKPIMNKWGFAWGAWTMYGGTFPRKRADPMHWVFADVTLLA